jgi:hypothetical protein
MYVIINCGWLILLFLIIRPTKMPNITWQGSKVHFSIPSEFITRAQRGKYYTRDEKTL